MASVVILSKTPPHSDAGDAFTSIDIDVDEFSGFQLTSA